MFFLRPPLYDKGDIELVELTDVDALLEFIRVDKLFGIAGAFSFSLRFPTFRLSFE